MIEVDVVAPSSEALIVTDVFELVGLLESVNVDWYDPSATVTLVGTGNNDGLVLLKATVVPPAGA